MDCRLVLRVPLPPRELSPNGQHGHWTTESTGRRYYRLAVKFDALNAVRKAHWVMPERVRVSLLFCTAGVRATGLYAPRDAPNAVSAFKAGFDGLVDAGVMPDDDWSHMWLGDVNLDPSSGPWIDVVVEPMPALPRKGRGQRDRSAGEAGPEL